MTSALSLRFSMQAQVDIQRIQRELSDLQRQVASGAKSNDLLGFGEAAGRLIDTQGARAVLDARGSVYVQMESRFGVQASALRQAAQSITDLSTKVQDAISANDGRGLALELQLAFAGLYGGLNETWNGQPLFAGERTGAGPIKITSADDLLTATTADEIFDEAARSQTLDLGSGAVVEIADKASEISTSAFDALRSLKVLLTQNGGELDSPLSAGQVSALQAVAYDLQGAARDLNSAEGRTGQLARRFNSEIARVQERSSLLSAEIGEIADADLAQVSVRLNSLLTQYEAAAKTFSDLSKLSLLTYL